MIHYIVRRVSAPFVDVVEHTSLKHHSGHYSDSGAQLSTSRTSPQPRHLTTVHVSSGAQINFDGGCSNPRLIVSHHLPFPSHGKNGYTTRPPGSRLALEHAKVPRSPTCAGSASLSTRSLSRAITYGGYNRQVGFTWEDRGR